MPTYDYRCEACGHAFEHFQSMTSQRLRACPVCKRRKLIRLVGAGAGVIFKGSGFYETDYKRAGKPAEEGTPPATAAPDPGKGQSPEAGSGAADAAGGSSNSGQSTSGRSKSAGSKSGGSKSGGSKSGAAKPGAAGSGGSTAGPAKE